MNQRYFNQSEMRTRTSCSDHIAVSNSPLTALEEEKMMNEWMMDGQTDGEGGGDEEMTGRWMY